MSNQKIIILEDTCLKAFPEQSAMLKARGLKDEVIDIKAGTRLQIVDQLSYEGPPGSAGDHVYVELVATPVATTNERRWFVFGAHVIVEGLEDGNNPEQDEPVTKQVVNSAEPDYGPNIRIKGISSPVGLFQPVYDGSNFSWAEWTKGGARLPVDSLVTQRIVRTCRYLDSVRTYLGDRPIRITSGYRDPVSNRRVGGARNSRHMYGDAVDFSVDGLSCVEVFKRLKTYHPQGGLAVGNGFVHLDLRPGPAARWSYPGGPRVALW
ncbi:MAG: D-Ala-D-Ala carboxypeptidase family metallohydrolase [Cyanobacteria bacterium J06560_5]